MAGEYQLTNIQGFDGVRRVADNAFIPDHGGNRDWQAYLEWLAAGNEPDPASLSQALDEAAR
jgi:hypothetical protein